VNTNATSFKKRFAIRAAIGIGTVVAGFYGCGNGDDNVPAAPPPDGGSHPDATTPGPDSGMMPSPDSGAPDADAGSTTITQKVAITKLFADTADAGAAAVDPNLMNPWGLAFNPSGPAWVSNNHAGVASVYVPGATAPLLTVTVPVPADGGTPPSAPTGQIFNGSADFKGDRFIICTEDGTISGWQPGDAALPTTATLRADRSGGHANYKGLAIAPSTPAVLVAADFHNAKIDAFDVDYLPIAANGKWTDPSIPSGYAPFNIVTIGTSVYVTYAKQDNPADAADDAKGAGFGAVSVFAADGTLSKSLIKTGGALNAPWGLTAVAAGGFGSIPAGALLIGNFGDGTVHAYDATSGALIGTLTTSAGLPLIIDGLWALHFGAADTDAGESKQQLYFTAGPNGEANGLFGYLTVAP
jgi:uncharacterized protein (TIGR03118 family)